MSTALRIASVTQFLRMLLQKGLSDNRVADIVPGSDTVSVTAPDKTEVTPSDEPSKLNLFMYQVTYNQGWRNFAQPAVNQQGERISSPPLAIDLHYLLTAYGKEELYAEILLGFGMQVFHEIPVMERSLISTFLTRANLPELLKELSTSELADQVEQIKITPELLSIEDISKLWAAFSSKYRATAAYKVTVVLIESNKSTKPGLPVINRNIYVNPFRQPVIEKILSQESDLLPVLEDQKILSGYRLVLSGSQLIHENVSVDIDDDPALRINTADINVGDKQLSFILPEILKAGIHEVRVVHPAMIGTPATEHAGIMSKVSTFVLSTSIVQPPVLSNRTENAHGLISGKINLKIKPALYPGQRVVLFLNENSGSDQAKAYSFKMPVLTTLIPPATTEDISIDISNVKKAVYLVRVNIDAAESPLQMELGKFVSPNIDLG